MLSPELGLIINTHTPTYAFWMLSACIIALLLFANRKYEAAVFSVALCVTIASVWILKQIFAIPRNADALIELSSYAFPSAHAAAGAFLAVMLFWLYMRIFSNTLKFGIPVAVVLFVCALVLGYSRVAIGVHSPLQVAGGFLLGIAVPLAVITHASFFYKRYFSFLFK